MSEIVQRYYGDEALPDGPDHIADAGKMIPADEAAKPAPDLSQDVINAAMALIERWHTPSWKDAEHTGNFIKALDVAVKAEAERRGVNEHKEIENELH